MGVLIRGSSKSSGEATIKREWPLNDNRPRTLKRNIVIGEVNGNAL